MLFYWFQQNKSRYKGHVASRTVGLCLLIVLLGANSFQPLYAGETAQNATREATGWTLVSVSNTQIIARFTLPPFVLEEGGDHLGSCQRVAGSGLTPAGEPGQPQLPVVNQLVGLPPAQDFVVSVTPLQTTVLTGIGRLCPALDSQIIVAEDGQAQYVETAADPDPAIYGQAGLFPAVLGRLDVLGYLRSQRLGRLELSPFQIEPVRGELLVHRQLEISVQWTNSSSTFSAIRKAEPVLFDAALQDMLINPESAQSWRIGSAASRTALSWQPPSPAYRVHVTEKGFYRLDRAALAAAGLPVDTLNPRTLRLFDNGQEIKISVSGEEDQRLDQGDALLFYGQPLNNRYTQTNVYWLTYGGANGQRITTAVAADSTGNAVSEPHLVRQEDNLNYASALPEEEGYDHWYGGRIDAVGSGQIGKRTFLVATDNLPTGVLTASVQIALAAHTSGNHHVRISINGQSVHNESWQGRTYHITQAYFNQSLLREGNNTVLLEVINDMPNQLIDQIYVDWLQMTYQRRPVAQANQLWIESTAGSPNRYTVEGFTDAQIQLYDVTNPAAPQSVPLANLTAAGANVAASFVAAANQDRTYLALSAGAFKSPPTLEPAAPANLINPGSGADYLIIAPPIFVGSEPLQKLVALRTAQGLRVVVANTQDIYDLFGDGTLSAEAIRDFLAHAYETWPGSAPSYVVLVGDGHYDMRDYLHTGKPVLIPPFLALVDPDLGETAADNRYVAVAGDDLIPDMHLGRLPVNSVAELAAVVKKIIAYETTPAGNGWNRNALFVSDNLEGGGGAFYNYSNSIADGLMPSSDLPIIPETFNKVKVYLGDTCADEEPSIICRNQIISQISQGALFVSYVGHGLRDGWAQESLLNTAAITEMTNLNRYPIILAMTCLEGYFHHPEFSALAESMVRAPDRGAVASWSPTGYGLATGHDLLEKGFLIAIFHNDVATLGPATTAGKLHLLENAPSGKYRDLLDTFVLLGDPAQRINLPSEETNLFLPIVLR